MFATCVCLVRGGAKTGVSVVEGSCGQMASAFVEWFKKSCRAQDG